MKKNINKKTDAALRSKKAHAPVQESNHSKDITSAIKSKMRKKPRGGFHGGLTWYPEK